MSKRYDLNPPLPASAARWWFASLRGNAGVLVAICIAAWVGYQIEFLERDVSPFRWFGSDALKFHFGPYPARIVMLTAIGVIMAVSLQLINGISGQFSLGHAGFMAVGAYLSGYASSTYGALDPDDMATSYQNVGQVFCYLLSLAIVMAAAGAVLAVVFVLIRQSRKIAHALPPVLLLLVLAWLTYDFSAGYEAEVVPRYLLWTRLIHAIGGLFDALLLHGMPPARAFSLWLTPPVRRPLCMIVLLGGGGFFAGVAGLLVGLPTLRLRGDYLAIATLGFAQILSIIFINSVPLGRATGLSLNPYSNTADPDRDPVAHYICPWILAMMILTIVMVWRIAYSPKGRLIRAVREDEIAAAAVGINTTRQKVTAFIFGAFFAGVGGVLYIHLEGYVHPEKTFGIDKSVLFVVMVTLGGLGSISGAILAGALLTLLPFFFRQLASAPSVPHPLQKVFENQLALFALALIIMMLLRPRGLLGRRELWWRRNRRTFASAPAAGAATP